MTPRLPPWWWSTPADPARTHGSRSLPRYVPASPSSARSCASRSRVGGTRHSALHRPPDNSKVDASVIMDEKVPYVVHEPPLDVWAACLDVGWDMTRRFAHDRDAVKYG